MVPNVVPSISMALILVPKSQDEALTPARQTSWLRAGRLDALVPIVYQTRTGCTPFRPLFRGRRDPARQFTRRRMSADVGDALLGFRFSIALGLRGKREDSRVLPFIEPRQEHDLAIRELERVMIGVKRALINLAKDRNAVGGIGKHEGGLILDWLVECQ